MIFEYDKIEPNQRYKLMSQTVIPRPIAWIVTKNKEINIAPFSYFIPLSSNPPILIVSIGHKLDDTPKDTLKNIRLTKKCTICIPNLEDKEDVIKTSASLDYEVSEAKEFNIKTKEILSDFPPIIQGSKVAFFCELYQEIKIEKSRTIPLILQIKSQFIDDEIFSGDQIDFSPLGRVGSEYVKLIKI